MPSQAPHFAATPGRRTGLGLALALTTLLWAPAALAQHLALVVANGRYQAMDPVPGAQDVTAAAAALTAQGFEVISVTNGTARDIARAVDRFAAAAPAADRLLVVLQGHVVWSASDTILLPVDAPKEVALPAALRTGIALSAIYPALAEHQGRAVLVVGTGPEDGDASRWTAFGARLDNVPNGVTLITGTAQRTSWFTVNALARAGMNVTEAFRSFDGLTAEGYLPADYVFLPLDRPAPVPVPVPDSDPATELVFWEATRRADTAAGYEAYLRRYPNGPHAAEANKYLEEIRTEPDRADRLVEDGLALTRDQRREIQRSLSLLGHDPRGIDGIFGQGSRTAIRAWQAANGLRQTGYVTRQQIATLQQQARTRAAQLEAEAEARRLEKDRQDRAYWEQSGAVGDEAGLRAYLDRYPDGVFASVARDRLAAIEERNRARAEAQERRLWDEVLAENSVPAYRRYLERYPRGTFAEEARDRIRRIEAEAAGAADRSRAEAAEAALGMNDQMRQLIEGRLRDLGLDPGTADGVFDDNTRRALRRYQEARGLTATGYVDENTVVRLLAEVILPGGR